MRNKGSSLKGNRNKRTVNRSGITRPGSLVLLLAVLAGLVLAAGCTGSQGGGIPAKNETNITITDSQGNTFHLPGPAIRIVTLNSDSTEMLIALGAGGSVVGVTETTLNNPQLSPLIPNATSVGTWDAPNLERIMSLRPDAIISYSGYRLKNADQFERANIPVIYLDCNRLSTIRADARSMGAIAGREAEAERYTRFVDKWEHYIAEKTGSDDPTPVYIEGYSEYMAQGSGSSIDDLVGLARGRNLAAGQGQSYLKVTPEWLIKEEPPVIIKVASDPLPEGKTLGSYREQVADRPALANVPAVQDGRVYALSGKIAVGPQAAAGLPVVAAILHPESFAGTDPLEAIDEYARDFVPGANATQVVSPLF